MRRKSFLPVTKTMWYPVNTKITMITVSVSSPGLAEPIKKKKQIFVSIVSDMLCIVPMKKIMHTNLQCFHNGHGPVTGTGSAGAQLFKPDFIVDITT